MTASMSARPFRMPSTRLVATRACSGGATSAPPLRAALRTAPGASSRPLAARASCADASASMKQASACMRTASRSTVASQPPCGAHAPSRTRSAARRTSAASPMPHAAFITSHQIPSSSKSTRLSASSSDDGGSGRALSSSTIARLSREERSATPLASMPLPLPPSSRTRSMRSSACSCAPSGWW